MDILYLQHMWNSNGKTGTVSKMFLCFRKKRRIQLVTPRKTLHTKHCVRRCLNKARYLKIILLASIALLIGACGQKEREAVNQQPPENYETYENQELKLAYPSHWILKFDEAPDFSTDRSVIFEVSELSRVTLYIYEQPGKSFSSIADHLTNRLNLGADESIRDYQRFPVVIGGHEGLKLTWQETELFTYQVELTILQILDSPSDVVIAFDLDEEDIENETPNIIPVIQSIALQ